MAKTSESKSGKKTALTKTSKSKSGKKSTKPASSSLGVVRGESSTAQTTYGQTDHDVANPGYDSSVDEQDDALVAFHYHDSHSGTDIAPVGGPLTDRIWSDEMYTAAVYEPVLEPTYDLNNPSAYSIDRFQNQHAVHGPYIGSSVMTAPAPTTTAATEADFIWVTDTGNFHVLDGMIGSQSQGHAASHAETPSRGGNYDK